MTGRPRRTRSLYEFTLTIALVKAELHGWRDARKTLYALGQRPDLSAIQRAAIRQDRQRIGALCESLSRKVNNLQTRSRKLYPVDTAK